MDITKAISHCRPGADWSLNGSEYSGLVWRDKVQTKPTEEELMTAWVEFSTQISPAERRAAMAVVFDGLPVDIQAAFYVARITAEAAMDRGRFDIAAAIIDAQQVPPELATVKDAILVHLRTNL